MTFVLRKAMDNLADTTCAMDIPQGALMVAPPTFFARFGKSFSDPTREEILEDLKRNLMFHAVPADEKRRNRTPFVIRRVHSSRVKDALAGKLVKEMVKPQDPTSNLLAKELVPDKKVEVEPDPVNVYACTSTQLLALATKHKIPNAETMPRKELTKAIHAAMNPPVKGPDKGAEN